MSVDQFEYLSGSVEKALDAADRQVATTTSRYTHGEVFDSIRRVLGDGGEARPL